VLDLGSGRSVDLPRSERAKIRDLWDDAWYTSVATKELIREDGAEKVDIFAWPSLEVKASFKLATETRPDERATLLSIRASHDGKHLAGLEFVTNSNRKNRVLVFDRSGQILLTGPYQDREGDGGGFEWLPDGRLVYFDKGALKIHDMTLGQSSPVPVNYPIEVKPGYEGLAVSPDGRSLAITKWVAVRNSRGESRDMTAVFRVDLGGGLAQLVAYPNQARIDDPLRMDFLALSWSKDGRWLSFLAEVGRDRWGSGLGNGGCPYAYAIPSQTAVPLLIDGFQGDGNLLHRPNGQGGWTPVRSCRSVYWL